MNSYKETKKHFRATKILATLGSASNDMDQISSLVEAGVNIFRMNFSHGTHEEHLLRIQMVREIEKARSIPIGILADMQGPKYRVGEVAEGTSLVEGASIQFDQTNKIGNSERLPLPHSEIFKALYPGARVLMDDGKLELIVKSLTDTTFVAEVKTGGAVSSRKGVNLPDIKLDTDALTEKDLIDLEFALNNGADWIALSFVQSVSDVLEAKVKIAGRAQLMAKIEKPAALDEIEDIINAADAIMIARGDLGVELDAAEVPAVQKKLIYQCRRVGKPVVVATQMLESMISSPTPTRAEATDVAGAVFDGADAVMLSAETAIGAYPVIAVETMARILISAETHIKTFPFDGPAPLTVEPSIYHAVAKAAVELAQTIEAKVIIAYSTSGNTAVRIARERPLIPLFISTVELNIQRRLSILYGATTSCQSETDYEAALLLTKQMLQKADIVRKNDAIVVVAGFPFGLSGSTNSIRVEHI
ncbi:pyruvate kinase [Alphaproteobacteria bacterium]|nr:pyruvate kinase [Alphaproteobacteria bacterium]